MDFLVLNNLQFHAFHGVFEQEQLIGNTYFVDLKIGADFSKACETDLIEDTLDYTSIFHEVKEEMVKPCKLIEHLAENICRRLKKQFSKIQSVEIKLTKQNPPLRGQLESVSIILVR
jgi:7,8-dihydroneopterin aldolase/epimerase/oxygenase